MTRADAAHSLTMRDLQSMLRVSRRVISGLVEAGFVMPARGPRNTLRFTFQDVVLLRTALQLRASSIAPRKIVQALARLRSELPDELPLSGIRVTAVGSEIAVRTGPSQWDAITGQHLLDFEVAEIKGDVVFLESSPATKDAARQAEEWYDLGGQLMSADLKGAEQAYRKAIALSNEPFYAAYVDLGALLCESEGRAEDALRVFDEALSHFPDDAVLHFNRAVALEGLDRLAQAERSYERCLELDPSYADAHHNLAMLLESLGDKQGLLRHLNAYRRLTS
ncbi:tetratricopeptide repeat protein [Paraburkholderia sp. LEh10]|uniref:tetratricopeptide repeat protein n=1 Tax=Paraburkholderia sp. LEh10 TaxID=2821353 RepID=UPI001AE43921|nr:tetratricopeptide repeat protein [Paraburkholderia sp. LEh10]MBP0595573.1 tetratricopeptide repeat protein [Paraburkholderia sp. LEh10]